MSERWKPENGDSYYCIFANGNIDRTVWKNIPTDKSLFERGNCFKTEAEAQAAAEKVKSLLLSLHATQDKALPKLTAEVFDRPDCPDWAKYAAVDADGDGFYYEDKPRTCEADGEWLVDKCIVGTNRIITGDFDPTDWQNSLIERPDVLPDWCKVEQFGYDTAREEYFKIVAVTPFNVEVAYLNREWSYCIGNPIFKADCIQARLRPYNADEMKALVGKVVDKNDGDAFVVAAYTPELDSRKLSAVDIDDMWVTPDAVLEYFTINGEPCGKFEHLENGEWVK